MTTVSEVPLASRPRSVRPGDVLVALGLIVAELVLGWFTYDIARALDEHLSTSRPVQWFYVMLPSLLLAVVVALHAIRPHRALTACLAALGAGAAYVAQLELVRWIFTHRSSVSYHVTEVTGYGAVMLAATLAALAWGLSRRHGRVWPTGLLVAAGAAWLTLWTNWPDRLGWTRFVSPLDTTGIRRAELVHAVAVMVPVVAACVVCWLIDVAELRREAASSSYDEGPPPR
jgi:hypothetical protein